MDLEKKTERWDLRVQPTLDISVKELADKLGRSRNSLIENVLWKATTHPELLFVCCPLCNEPQFDVWEIAIEGVQKFECSQGHTFVYDFDEEIIESGRITIDPAKRSGQPCIRGYRTTVDDVVSWLVSGMSYEEILEDFPFLEREDIIAALDFMYKTRHGS